MPAIIEGVKNYTGPKTKEFGETFPEVGVFVHSLPQMGKGGDMSRYHPTLKTVDGIRGYAINSRMSFRSEGIVINWIPRSLGDEGDPIWVPRTHLEGKNIEAVLRIKDAEFAIRIRYPQSPYESFRTKPWAF